MPEVDRLVLWSAPRGEACYHEHVACAVRRDLASPARELWEALCRGDWEDDPHFNGPPPDGEQIYDSVKFLAEIEYIGQHGRPSHGRAVNYLRNGIWELKVGQHRIAYFDTPGTGEYLMKERARDWQQVEPDLQGDEYWWYPNMDVQLRLTNGWGKTGQFAPGASIALAEEIREEDVEHDRTGR